MATSDRFVRVPTDLFETLLRTRLSGTQWRIVFWVIRRTLGWNRETTPFSWYRMAAELAMDRGGVVRAGHHLLHTGILHLIRDEIGIRPVEKLPPDSTPASPKRAMTKVSADRRQRKPMTVVIATDDKSQRKRCQESSLFRRAKDSSKDKLKTKRKAIQIADSARQASLHRACIVSTSGAAQPIPGKYDNLPQDR